MRKLCQLGLLSIFFFSACSSYGIKKDISLKEEIRALQSTGIIIRISEKGILGQNECLTSLLSWLESTRQLKKIQLIPSTSAGISRWTAREERLYQVSPDGDFQKYKSLGVGRVYLRDRGSELKKIMEDNVLESLIIFEIDGMVSKEMEFLDSESVVMLVKKDLSVLYLDHAMENIDVDVSDEGVMKRMLLDRLSSRLLTTLENLDFLVMD